MLIARAAWLWILWMRNVRCVFSDSGAVWEEMTKHNWRILKDWNQTDTFNVTYLAFTGIPILMDVTHHLAHVSLHDSLCQFCSKSCCLLLYSGWWWERERFNASEKGRTIIFCYRIVFISVEIPDTLNPSNPWQQAESVACLLPKYTLCRDFMPLEEWSIKLSFIFPGPLVGMSRPGEGITPGQFSKQLTRRPEIESVSVSFLIDNVQYCLHSLRMKYATRAPHQCGQVQIRR